MSIRSRIHRTPWSRRLVKVTVAAVLASSVVACSGRRYDPARAASPYPTHLDQGEVVDVQVFREGGDLIIVNATPQSFRDADIWVNRRYLWHLDSLEPGETRRVWFGEFFDQWGETPVAGGFFRTERPTPVVLLQIQIGSEEPLLGTISVPAEQNF